MQDALREQLSERVYQCLREEGGHIYVCGDVTMAGDVLKNVQQIIKQEGNMSLEDAGLFISKLRVRQMAAASFTAKRKSAQLLHTCECVARKYTVGASSGGGSQNTNWLWFCLECHHRRRRCRR